MSLSIGATLVVSAALSACSSEQELPPADLAQVSADERARCTDLLENLPASLLGQDRDETPTGVSDAGRVAVYGTVVVTCGVERPADYQPTAACNEVGGVGWYVPQEQLTDPARDLTAFALSHEPYVQLSARGSERIDGMDAALLDLAEVMNTTLGEGLACL